MIAIRPCVFVVVMSVGALSPACKEHPSSGGGVVAAADAAASPTSASDAAATTGGAQVDVSKCPGCQLVPQPSWSFEGIYADPACTQPVAQIDVPACANVPNLGDTTLAYVDAVPPRKAGEQANVTLTAQVAPQSARFRKAGTTCVKANETATAVTPAGCSAARVCRDEQGALTCGACRLLQNGCGDYEETRFYATYTDSAVKAGGGGGGGGGGGNLARLQQCCAALAAQGKALGSSPEGGLVAQAAAQCSAMLAAAGPNGNAPELGALRAILAGRNIPPICAGF